MVPRKALVRQRLMLNSVSLDDVKKSVQDGLEDLVEDVLARNPSVIAKHGSASGGVVRLFVYCSFSVGSDLESVIAGVTIQQKEKLKFIADIVGEESGCIYFSKSVDVDDDSLPIWQTTAGTLSAQLSREADVVIDALKS